MRRWIYAGIFVVGLAVAFCLGAKWGFDEGAQYFVYLDAPARAALDVGLLRSLRKGNTNSTQAYFETDIDYQLVQHYNFLTEGHEFFVGPEQRAVAAEAPKYMKRVAEYRKEYPPVTAPMFDENSEKGEEVRAFNRLLNSQSRIDRAAINSILSRYADK
jgi:hypothetical protein